MVSAKQPLSPFQARSNYKLVGQSFGSFVSAFGNTCPVYWETSFPFCLETQYEGSFNSSMPSFLSGTPVNQASSATGILLQGNLALAPQTVSQNDDSGLVLLGYLQLLWHLWVRFDIVVPFGSCVWFMNTVHLSFCYSCICVLCNKILEGPLSESPATHIGWIFTGTCYSVSHLCLDLSLQPEEQTVVPLRCSMMSTAFRLFHCFAHLSTGLTDQLGGQSPNYRKLTSFSHQTQSCLDMHHWPLKKKTSV